MKFNKHLYQPKFPHEYLLITDLTFHGVQENETLCAIWYHLYNLKNVKNIHGGVLLLVKLQASACNFIKSITPPWMFFPFFKLCKWYQIAQSITNSLDCKELLIFEESHNFVYDSNICS